jgi:predicted permease
MISGLHEFLGRAKSLFRKRRMSHDMAEELAFHQTLLRDKLLREGVPPSQVNATVRRTFGNPSRWHERLRELWQFQSIESLMRDIRFSIRLLKKSPGFTAIALLTLALGVGANAAVFSLINGLLLRPLPVPHGDQLIVLGMDHGSLRVQYSFPAPFFRALESRHEIFENVFAFFPQEMQVRGSLANENIPGMLVSGDYFNALQTPPLMGRYLTPADDRKGGSPEGLAVVISERFWEIWFHRLPSVVGSKLVIANTTFTVVGVMPKQFFGADPTHRPQIFAPLSAEPIIDAPRNLIDAGVHGWWLTVMARVRPGVTLEQANAALASMSMPIARSTVTDANSLTQMEKAHFRFTAAPGSKGFTYIRFSFKKPLIALFAMCGGILLLACLNLASLLMARGAARERELATRLAMGATRRRLVQQLLVESLLLALMGTAIGLIVAPLASQSLATMLMSGNTSEGVYLDTSIDIRVLGFAAITAIVATLLVGLLPALQATSGNLNKHIKDGQHATTGRRRKLLQPVMMASEVGLALILIVGAGLLATSLIKLFTAGAGFNPRGVVNIALDMQKQPLDGVALMQLYQQYVETMSHQPGITSASLVRIVPLSHSMWDQDHALPGGVSHDLYLNGIAPNYFQTMSIPLLAGRDFRWADTTPTGLKIILNQSAVKLFFGDRNPLGQHIIQTGDKKTDFEIVGVVGDAKYEDLRSDAPPAAYLPATQIEDKKPSYVVVVKTSGPLAPLANTARSLAAQMAPQIPAPVVTSMETVVENSLSTERVMALLSVFFAACALLVTGIGLYGTLSYNTARRTSEIGIRIALGARRAGVMVLVFRQNAKIAGAGLAIGLIAAILASRALASFLYETSPRDPWILIGSVAALATLASAASLLPAFRASRIQPTTAIRCE